jgi:uncharacterized protein
MPALQGKLEILQWLVSNGANIDAQDRSGYTALHFAVQEGHADCVNHLL